MYGLVQRLSRRHRAPTSTVHFAYPFFLTLTHKNRRAERFERRSARGQSARQSCSARSIASGVEVPGARAFPTKVAESALGLRPASDEDEDEATTSAGNAT